MESEVLDARPAPARRQARVGTALIGSRRRWPTTLHARWQWRDFVGRL
ncbi:hypothetical protein HMPREF1979_03122 [Actinomyces johnsonii F0542]|uniref:Uncharacterized protein n=1 Tax=Actinomyces johnsonii F0542 TaxID=1321818 RepID=U1Q0F9_9ACTO|nr:hypothetical protein HMPREF1979_03122 [Actinomyces johnsonii F0542]